MASPKRLVALDRKFLELSDKQEGYSALDIAVLARFSDKVFSWSKLLESKYVVVLGEAGTGKTTEFRQQAIRLDAGGSAAFFIELVELAKDGVIASLAAEAEKKLAAWCDGTEEGFFFLDSLDEAKLQRETLKTALRKLKKGLGPAWERAHLIISSRVSDWRPDADYAAVDDAVAKAPILTVHIAPLTMDDVETLAKAIGVHESDAFAAEIRSRYFEAFVERPLDVEWLGAYWLRHGKLGALHEVISEDIDEKLKEVPDRIQELAPTVARRGAAALALVATLTRQVAILVPGAGSTRVSETGVDPYQILANWTPSATDDLLRRGLFDESTYGRVRFHHRTVQDFLAAECLDELSRAGLNREVLDQLFFALDEHGYIVPGHLQPLSAWLSWKNDALRHRIAQASPSTLIAHGDPSTLRTQDRVDVLDAFASRYDFRARYFESFDRASLERFAHTDLVDAIAAIYAREDVADELEELLLELIEGGKLAAAARFALQTALDDHASERARCAAVRAVVRAGSDDQRRQLLELPEKTKAWPLDLAGVFIDEHYPDAIGVDGITAILERCTPSRRNLTTRLHGVLDTGIARATASSELARVADVLIAFATKASLGRRAMLNGRRWLQHGLSNIAVGVLTHLPKHIVPSETLLEFIELSLASFEHAHEMEVALRSHEAARRALFWRRVERAAERKNAPVTRYHELPYERGTIALKEDDIGWLQQDARRMLTEERQRLCFDVLCFIPMSSDDARLPMLRELAADSAILHAELTARTAPSSSAVDAALAEAELERSSWEEKRRKRVERVRSSLLSQVDDIRSGRHERALIHVLSEANILSGSTHAPRAEKVEELFGIEVASAFFEGLSAFWKTNMPVPLHELHPRIPYNSMIGLAGLEVDVGGGLELCDLEEDLLRRAVRYASWALNSFPPWLTSIAAKHPDLVADEFEQTLAVELGLSAPSSLFSMLAGAPEPVTAACSEVVLRLLRSADPASDEVLSSGLKVLGTSKKYQASILPMFEPRCLTNFTTPTRFAIYWTYWFELASRAAVDFLEKHLPALDREASYHLLEHVCSCINQAARGHSRMALSREGKLPALVKLYPMVFDVIRPEDDLVHESVYSPGPRDNAESLRDLLPEWIESGPATEVVAAFRALAEDTRLAERRDELLHRADACARLHAGDTTGAVADSLVNLFRKHGLDAKNHLREVEGNAMVDVAVITMKEEEFEALLKRFPSKRRRGKNRDYDVSSIDTPDGRCTVAVTRVSQQGNVNSAVATSEVIADLDPAFVLVVGIGGAVPSENFCLGDVVVSSSIIDFTLHDTGSAPDQRRYNAAGFALHTEASRIVDGLRAIEQGSENWATHEFLATRPSVAEHDQQLDESVQLALRAMEARAVPVAVAEKIGASDGVIKDLGVIIQLRSVVKGLACVEMESAGAHLVCHRAHKPIISIRGISDVVGFPRDERWMNYACAAAAAYAHMLIASGSMVRRT